MKVPISKSLLLLAIFISLAGRCYSQLPFGLKNGINSEPYCAKCQETIANKPHEVLFGIDIHTNGDVYFLMNNIEWFEKIFRLSSFGVSADIVSKERYNCNVKSYRETDFLRGQLLRPVYKSELLKDMETLQTGTVYVKIGKVPTNLIGKEIEGNLVILNGEMICYYTNFVNINRNVWELLPMGLFTDTLLKTALSEGKNNNDFFTYSKKVQFEIPFLKNKTTFDKEDIKPLYDSLKLKNYDIRKMEIRAYSSVEGPEKTNAQLMTGRANSLLEALKKYQPDMGRVRIITAENWLDFFHDIGNTKFSEWQDLSKLDIKQKLADNGFADELEPLLKNHRKAVVSLFIEETSKINFPVDSIISSFTKAIAEKDIATAMIIQKELVDEIKDNKIPVEYLNKLEIPAAKEYVAILNQREAYRYLLKATSEYEALDNFKALKKLEPTNGKINYNICALQFFIWQFGNDTAISKYLLNDINALEKMGIDPSLVKRMKINYHILKCDEYNKTFQYDDKDSSLNFIRNTYKLIPLTDEDIYSLARYFTNYAQADWAEEIIVPRIDKIDVSEDLIFYYINLLFFHFSEYDTDDFKKAVLNAINLNRQRYCDFFQPIDKGGASMQLLEYEDLKSIYCENCKK